MDAGGVKVAKPLYEGAKATYVTLVDPQNALGDALGFKVIPNGFFFDEAGVLQGMKVGGFEVSRQATIQSVEAFLSRPKVTTGGPPVPPPSLADLQRRHAAAPEDAELMLMLGKAYLSGGEPAKALPLLRKAVDAKATSSALFALGSAELSLGRREVGLVNLKKALRLDRGNFIIRKQIWLLEYPEKFHPTIDWEWQRGQLKKELEQEAKDTIIDRG
jgi:tetratricopeptide (TPR) repeat protein